MTDSHTGWFHRSDKGVLRWVPASGYTGRSAGSTAGADLGRNRLPARHLHRFKVRRRLMPTRWWRSRDATPRAWTTSWVSPRSR